MSEYCIPKHSYSEFFKRLENKAQSTRIPLFCSFEITMRCNLRCVHCYIPADQAVRTEELSYQEVCSILDEIAEAGCLWITFTGGEPFVRHDFLDIYDYALSKGFLVTIYTNATILTQAIVHHLKDRPPLNLEVSLYGISKEIYESITGIPDSFKQCMKSIKLLRNNGIRFLLKTPLMTLNKHEINAIMNYAQSLKVDFFCDPFLMPRLDHSKGPCKLRLTPKEVVEFELANEARVEVLKEWVSHSDYRHKDQLYMCSAGQIGFAVSATGKLLICGLCRSPSYDLKSGGFLKGWNDVVATLRQQKYKSGSECRRCQFRALCPQCPGRAYLENGDYEAPVEFLCRHTHLLTTELKKLGGE